jgi:hypothetical protein
MSTRGDAHSEISSRICLQVFNRLWNDPSSHKYWLTRIVHSLYAMVWKIIWRSSRGMSIRKEPDSCGCEVGTKDRLDFGPSLGQSDTITLRLSYSISDFLSLITQHKKEFFSEGSNQCFWT